MRQVKTVCITPDGIPRLCSIDADIMSLSRLVNIDKYGNPISDFEPFEICEIKDNINIISSPKGEERDLPVVRTVGRYTKFYGIVYIVKMDENYNLIDLTESEAMDYRIKFISKTVTLHDLELPEIDYPDDD